MQITDRAKIQERGRRIINTSRNNAIRLFSTLPNNSFTEPEASTVNCLLAGRSYVCGQS